MKINDSLDRMDMRGGGEYHCIGKNRNLVRDLVRSIFMLNMTTMRMT